MRSLLMVCLLCSSAAAEEVSPGFEGFYAGGAFSLSEGSAVHTDFDARTIAPTFDLDRSYDSGGLGAAVFGGYNLVRDDWLMGIEASIGADISSRGARFTPAIVESFLPYTNEWGCCATTPVPRVETSRSDGEILARYEYQNTYEIKKEFDPALSLRLGRVFGPLMIYGKAGAGAAMFKERLTYDGSDTLLCDGFFNRTEFFSDGSYVNQVTGCENIKRGPTDVQTSTKWLPTARVGVGAEYQIGVAFARFEGEFSQAFGDDFRFGQTGDGLSQLALASAIGFRF